MKEGSILDMEIVLHRDLPGGCKTIVGNRSLGKNALLTGYFQGLKNQPYQVTMTEIRKGRTHPVHISPSIHIALHIHNKTKGVLENEERYKVYVVALTV